MSQTKVELGLDVKALSTITTADNTDTLTLVSTDNDTAEGPILKFNRSVTDVANGDLDAAIKFQGENDAGEAIVYNELQSSLGNVADGSEGGRITLHQMIAGTARNIMDISQGNVIFNQDSVDVDFRVESNGNTHMLFVNGGDDRVGVGVGSSPAATLDVEGTQTGAPIIETHASSTSFATEISLIRCNRSTTDGSFKFIACNVLGVGDRFDVLDSGTARNATNTYTSNSDERLKSNIKDANSQWDDIKAVKVRNFTKYDMPDLTQIGVISQELEASGMNGLVMEVDPSKYEAKENSEFGTLYEEGDEIPEDKEVGDIKEVKEKVKVVKYSILYMKAIKALQEAMTRIETLETEVKALKG